MDEELFLFWIEYVFIFYIRKVLKINKEIILIVDNFSAHQISSAKLDEFNMEIIFLPPNITCYIQPLDLGIIANIKSNYKQNYLESWYQTMVESHRLPYTDMFVCQKFENGEQASFYEACSMLVNAWDRVSKTCIINCFVKSSLLKNMQVLNHEKTTKKMKKYQKRKKNNMINIFKKVIKINTGESGITKKHLEDVIVTWMNIDEEPVMNYDSLRNIIEI